MCSDCLPPDFRPKCSQSVSCLKNLEEEMNILMYCCILLFVYIPMCCGNTETFIFPLEGGISGNLLVSVKKRIFLLL